MSGEVSQTESVISQFLAEAVAKPSDPTPRLVLADWLEEQGDPRGELARIQEQLRNIDVPRRQQVEARMQQLLREGVQPVVPRWINSIGMRFVFIFPGEFMMGIEGDIEACSHPVRLTSGYWLSETVVTQSQWQRVMKTDPWAGRDDVTEHLDCPATYVSHDDAVRFCRQLSDRDFALPTEAQWEYACRAGTSSYYSFGDDHNEVPRYGWFDENPDGPDETEIHQVAHKHSNPWGLFDMHGNVWEWCHDVWSEHEPEPAVDPRGPQEASTWKVVKGGCSANPFDGVGGSGDRHISTSEESYIGFRVAQIPIPAS